MCGVINQRLFYGPFNLDDESWKTQKDGFKESLVIKWVNKMSL